MDATTLQFAAALVAVVASGVGVVVAVDQLTLRTRLRRTDAWAREAAATESDDHRKAALEALRLRSVAGVVGSHAVPFRFFATTLVTPIGSLALLVSAVRREEAAFPDLTALFFVSLVGCGIEFRRAVRLYLERRQVVNAYLAGGREVPGPRLDMMNTMEGGVRREFLAGIGLSVGLNGALAGIVMLQRDPEATFGPVLILVGVSVAGLAGFWVRMRGRVV